MNKKTYKKAVLSIAADLEKNSGTMLKMANVTIDVQSYWTQLETIHEEKTMTFFKDMLRTTLDLENRSKEMEFVTKAKVYPHYGYPETTGLAARVIDAAETMELLESKYDETDEEHRDELSVALIEVIFASIDIIIYNNLKIINKYFNPSKEKEGRTTKKSS